ncbi:MAG: hypothetical protein CL912_08310 [Deltaproteobacteria bacterium]|nr:hypothetical protein [Deltaproteobacteria bacterium]
MSLVHVFLWNKHPTDHRKWRAVQDLSDLVGAHVCLGDGSVHMAVAKVEEGLSRSTYPCDYNNLSRAWPSMGMILVLGGTWKVVRGMESLKYATGIWPCPWLIGLHITLWNILMPWRQLVWTVEAVEIGYREEDSVMFIFRNFALLIIDQEPEDHFQPNIEDKGR